MSRREDPYESIASFIRKYISSVGQLEVLLNVYWGRPTGFSPDKVALLLSTNRALALRHLVQLHHQGLIVVQGKGESQEFLYLASKDENTSTIEKMSELYSTHRIRIIDLIYSQKTDSIREFAEAFRIRKD